MRLNIRMSRSDDMRHILSQINNVDPTKYFANEAKNFKAWGQLCEAKRWTEDELIAMDTDDLDKLAYGYYGDQIIEIDPRKLKIIWPGDLPNPEYKFSKGGMAWVRSVDFSEPVDVSVNEDGELCLEDGHHRWFAAMKLGRKLKCKLEIKGNPVRTILRRQGDME